MPNRFSAPSAIDAARELRRYEVQFVDASSAVRLGCRFDIDIGMLIQPSSAMAHTCAMYKQLEYCMADLP
jgi:hypothetical protein